MTSKVLSYGGVRLLAVALLVGVGYILLNPTETQSQGSTGDLDQGRSEIVQNSAEVTDGGAEVADDGAEVVGDGAEVVGDGVEVADDCTEVADGSAGYGQEQPGQGRNAVVRNVTWETMTGTVISIDHEATIQTAAAEVLLGMGPSTYWVDFGLVVGDKITVVGFYEDGEFKAGTIENLATGATLTLRDETGRPVWAGQTQLRNQDS